MLDIRREMPDVSLTKDEFKLRFRQKHWHGATPTTAMTHIAIQEALDGKKYRDAGIRQMLRLKHAVGMRQRPDRSQRHGTSAHPNGFSKVRSRRVHSMI